jgi:hypothetical protein
MITPYKNTWEKHATHCHCFNSRTSLKITKSSGPTSFGFLCIFIAVRLYSTPKLILNFLRIELIGKGTNKTN